MATTVATDRTLAVGDYVKIDWSIKIKGEPLPDSVFDEGVCHLVVGNGYIPPLHDVLLREALPLNEEKVFRIPNMFGERNAELWAKVDASQAPPGLKVGDQVRLSSGMTAFVVAMDEESVTIDANRPFAGETGEVRVTLLEKLDASSLKTITFGGGCFWGVELAFQRLPGVVATSVGYAQGSKLDPTYEDVCSGTTGHTEAVKVLYDPKLVDLETILDLFWDRLGENRFALNQVGNDRGTQYRHGIYLPENDDAAKKIAEASFEEQQAKHVDRPIATELEALTVFYDAEDYHQQYLQKGGQSAKKEATDTIRCYG